MWDLIEVGATLVAALACGAIGYFFGYCAGRWAQHTRVRRNNSHPVGETLSPSAISDLERLMGTTDVEEESFGSAVDALNEEDLYSISRRLYAQSTTLREALSLFTEVRRLGGHR
jgi:hypothetical protein